MTIRLLMVAPFPPARDGVGRYTANLLTALPDHVQATVLTARKPNQSSNLDPPAIAVVRQGTAGPLGFARSWRAIRQSGPDVVHIQFAVSLLNGWALWTMVAAVVARVPGRYRLIVTDHEVKRDLERLGPVGVVTHGVVGAAASTVIVHTEESARLLTQRCRVAPAKLRVLPLGVPKTTVVEEGPLPTIVVFGFIHPDKGIDNLLRALLAMRDQGAALPLVRIVGEVRARRGIFRWFGRQDRAYLRHLESLVGELGLKGNVEFSGYMPSGEVPITLGSATLVVAPYLRSTQSAVLNEAFAAGAAVVASALPGLQQDAVGAAEWVPPGDVRALADALTRLLADPAERRRLRQGARATAEKHSLRQVAGALSRVYDGVLSDRDRDLDDGVLDDRVLDAGP